MQEQQRAPLVGTLNGQLATLSSLESSLDGEFKEKLKCSSGLFEFLFVKEVDILTPLVLKLLEYFDEKSNTFKINGYEMGITLQDVLFLCHLGIKGKQVIVDHCPSDVAFQRVFSQDHTKKGRLNTEFLTGIALNKDRSLEQRKIATLLVIIKSVIMPSSDGNRTTTSFVELLENLDGVSEYAWGAALLAFLFSGIHKFLFSKKKSLDGNFWLVLAFFFVRIPKLWNAIGLDIKDLTTPNKDSPRLFWVIENLKKISKNHKLDYKKVDKLLDNLVDDDIKWLPYKEWELPQHLKKDLYFVNRVGPIFCNNFVVHHRPHFVAKQFGYNHDDFAEDAFEFLNYNIPIKDNRGQFPHKYREIYKKELNIWEDGKCLADFVLRRSSDTESSDIEPPHNTIDNDESQSETESPHNHNDNDESEGEPKTPPRQKRQCKIPPKLPYSPKPRTNKGCRRGGRGGGIGN